MAFEVDKTIVNQNTDTATFAFTTAFAIAGETAAAMPHNRASRGAELATTCHTFTSSG